MNEGEGRTTRERARRRMCDVRARHEVTLNFTDSLIDALLVHTTSWR
jgi:hypothetical protein